jgi:hypothetical protein
MVTGGIAPRTHILGTVWNWAVSFTPRPLYPRGKSSWYPLDRRVGGPQSRSGHGGKEKKSPFVAHAVQPVVQSHWLAPRTYRNLQRGIRLNALTLSRDSRVTVGPLNERSWLIIQAELSVTICSSVVLTRGIFLFRIGWRTFWSVILGPEQIKGFEPWWYFVLTIRGQNGVIHQVENFWPLQNHMTVSRKRKHNSTNHQRREGEASAWEKLSTLSNVLFIEGHI